MNDIFPIIGACTGLIGLLVSILVAVLNGRRDFKAEIKTEMQEVAAVKTRCAETHSALATKTAVLEERLANQASLIQTAIEKLDAIKDKL